MVLRAYVLMLAFVIPAHADFDSALSTLAHQLNELDKEMKVGPGGGKSSKNVTVPFTVSGVQKKLSGTTYDTVRLISFAQDCFAIADIAATSVIAKIYGGESYGRAGLYLDTTVFIEPSAMERKQRKAILKGKQHITWQKMWNVQESFIYLNNRGERLYIESGTGTDGIDLNINHGKAYENKLGRDTIVSYLELRHPEFKAIINDNTLWRGRSSMGNGTSINWFSLEPFWVSLEDNNQCLIAISYGNNPDKLLLGSVVLRDISLVDYQCSEDEFIIVGYENGNIVRYKINYSADWLSSEDKFEKANIDEEFKRVREILVDKKSMEAFVNKNLPKQLREPKVKCSSLSVSKNGDTFIAVIDVQATQATSLDQAFLLAASSQKLRDTFALVLRGKVVDKKVNLQVVDLPVWEWRTGINSDQKLILEKLGSMYDSTRPPYFAPRLYNDQGVLYIELVGQDDGNLKIFKFES